MTQEVGNRICRGGVGWGEGGPKTCVSGPVMGKNLNGASLDILQKATVPKS